MHLCALCESFSLYLLKNQLLLKLTCSNRKPINNASFLKVLELANLFPISLSICDIL
jgi:hypothetical protein